MSKINNLRIYNSGKRRLAFVLASLAFAGFAMGISSCESNTDAKESTSSNGRRSGRSVSSTVDNDVKTTDNIMKDGVIKLDDLGVELEPLTEGNSTKENINKKTYGSVTGNVDVNKIVRGSDGSIYVDKEAVDKASLVGETKSGTTSKETTKGYEIKDEKGNVTKGNGEIPEGYTKDPEFEGYIKEEDAGKYVKSDANYYSGSELIIEKGEYVSKETLDRAKKELSTKPTSEKTQSTTSDSAKSTSSKPSTTSSKDKTSSKVIETNEEPELAEIYGELCWLYPDGTYKPYEKVYTR